MVSTANANPLQEIEGGGDSTINQALKLPMHRDMIKCTSLPLCGRLRTKLYGCNTDKIYSTKVQNPRRYGGAHSG